MLASASLVVGIVVGFVVVLAILLFLGGLVATGRRRDALRRRLAEQVEAADAELARARAADRGWERAAIEAAASAAFAARHGHEPNELLLVQVVDQPGTDADQAVLRALGDGQDETITLGRRDGAWVAL